MYIHPSARRGILIWLYSGIILVFCMIAVGGITRLTESGLSITEWNVVMGSVPPTSDADWQAEFDKYKQSPEFRYKNFDFSLQQFKSIYWWEWTHRLLGRLIGLVFFLPFLYFLLRKKLTAKGVNRLLVIFVLGGLQGFIGWYMVQSGLVDEPRVSHYRLALHLITALLTISLIWWLTLDIRFPRNAAQPAGTQPYRNMLLAFFVIFTIQLIYGAFVAGLDAGQIYNTWPKMGEHWIAPGTFSGRPWHVSLYDQRHLVTIQFMHRMIAVVLVIFAGALWFRSRKETSSPAQKQGIQLMLGMICLQFLLGVCTLLLHVPVWLGVLHQLGAVLLLLSSLFHAHRVYRP